MVPNSNHQAKTGRYQIHLELHFRRVVLLLGLLFVLMEILLYYGSRLSPGNYGRYLDVIWANNILATGHINSQPFSQSPSLFSNANSYSFNLVPALYMATSSLLIGVDVIAIQLSPLFAVGYFASVVLAGSALYPNSRSGLVFGILLACFFVYTDAGVATGINRIVLAFLVFNLFIYAFVRSIARPDIRMRALGLIFLVYFVFTYSSYAVTGIGLVLTFLLLEARRVRRWNQVSIGVLYVCICLFYYLLMTNFLGTGIAGLKRVFETRGLTFDFSLFTNPGVWPSPMQFSPMYSQLDWFLLVYPFVILAILLMYAIVWRANEYRRTRGYQIYDSFLASFVVFVVLAAVVNAWAVLATSGLDYISLFGWLAPILAVAPLRRLVAADVSTSESKRSVSLGSHPAGQFAIRHPTRTWSSTTTRSRSQLTSTVTALVVVTLGVVSTLHYPSLQPRIAEKVSDSEIAAAKWLATRNLTAVSDLHFLSSYVTVGGPGASHFLPLTREAVLETYYNTNISYLKEQRVSAFVVSRTMTTLYIANFDGTRTIPNPELPSVLSRGWNLVYDNGEFQVFDSPIP